jgi:hypothetical protein
MGFFFSCGRGLNNHLFLKNGTEKGFVNYTTQMKPWALVKVQTDTESPGLGLRLHF